MLISTSYSLPEALLQQSGSIGSGQYIRRYDDAMKRLPALILALAACLSVAASAQTASPAPSAVFPGTEWAHTNPAAAGWDLDRMQRVDAYAKEIGATAVMLIQHGLVVSQGGDVAARTELHSCRKSFLSALIGNAVARNQIRLDNTLDSLGIDDNPPSLTLEEKQATVRMLIEARSGIYHPSLYETTGMAERRPERGSHAPGTFWYYNNWDFNTLGSIYEKAVGRSIFESLEQEIASPIGMQDFRAKDGRYVLGPESRFPAYPMRMSARDFARFALLYLRGGNWAGTQVVPAQWVAESTHPWSDAESGGYGYLWWTGNSATPGHHPEHVFPPGSFWLEGHLGQYAVIVPSHDLIVVVRVEGDHPKKAVHKGEMAKLVRLVVEATEH
jgi:CubicO group peptidase (beta-lactamase class C family)